MVVWVGEGIVVCIGWGRRCEGPISEEVCVYVVCSGLDEGRCVRSLVLEVLEVLEFLLIYISSSYLPKSTQKSKL